MGTLCQVSRQLDWRGTNPQCGSLVALRRRLSPGLPLSSPPMGVHDHAVLRWDGAAGVRSR